MARRFTPFYQSLANRGMKNTNKSIGNLNTFPGNSYGFENQGSGIGNYLNPPNNFKNPSPIGNSVGAMGGGNIYDPGNWSGEGIPDEQEVPGGPGVGGWYNPWGPDPDYEPGTYKPPEAPDIGGIVSNENFLPNWKDDTDLGGQQMPPMPDDDLPQGYEWQWVNGNWEPVLTDSGISKAPPQLGGIEVPGGNTLTPPYLEEQEEIKGPVPDDELPEGWEWQWVNGNWEPVQGGTGTGTELNIPPNYQEDNPFLGQKWDLHETMEGGFDINNDGIIDMRDYELAQSEGQGTGYEQEFLENLLNYINPQQYSPQEFTGGGGQGGQAARKLYYPGASGGFASVGSGIGGGNTLDELLKQLRG
tara:strand:+ start:1047 stop:2123 length:1077 start_codon:yes stop_codon:yes gene_type:complete